MPGTFCIVPGTFLNLKKKSQADLPEISTRNFGSLPSLDIKDVKGAHALRPQVTLSLPFRFSIPNCPL